MSRNQYSSGFVEADENRKKHEQRTARDRGNNSRTSAQHAAPRPRRFRPRPSRTIVFPRARFFVCSFVFVLASAFDDGPVVSAAPVRQAPRPKQPRVPSASALTAQGQQAQREVQAAAQQTQAAARQGAAQVQAAGRQAAAETTKAARAAGNAAQRRAEEGAPVVAAVAIGAAQAGGAAVAASAPAKKGFSLFGAKAQAAEEPMDEIALREANLKAREEKMLAKELEVEAREREVRSKELASKNWPCRCFRIAYHSIPDQIPARLQPMIKKFYYLMFWTWIGLFWNLVTVLTYWGEADSDQGILWAALYFVVGVPGSWWVWYRQVYFGAARARGRKYVFFFVGFFLHMLISIAIGVGIPTIGCGGLLVMLAAFSKSYTASGIFALIITVMFGINILISIYLFKKARDAWRSGGGKEELEKDRKKMKLAAKAGSAAV